MSRGKACVSLFIILSTSVAVFHVVYVMGTLVAVSRGKVCLSIESCAALNCSAPHPACPKCVGVPSSTNIGIHVAFTMFFVLSLSCFVMCSAVALGWGSVTTMPRSRAVGLPALFLLCVYASASMGGLCAGGSLGGICIRETSYLRDVLDVAHLGCPKCVVAPLYIYVGMWATMGLSCVLGTLLMSLVPIICSDDFLRWDWSHPGEALSAGDEGALSLGTDRPDTGATAV